jgi:hypothetical protein
MVGCGLLVSTIAIFLIFCVAAARRHWQVTLIKPLNLI